jgi:hypothetical protein
MNASRTHRRSPRRLAVLAVSTTLAVSASAAQAAPVQSSAAEPAAHWLVVPEAAAARPPENVVALARNLGVDTDFAWKMLDELTPEPRRS